MGYAAVYIREIVRKSVEHSWSIPEFQRGFVWKTTQVRDLIESLWLDYPVGTLLIWDSARPVETRSATDSQGPSQWVVDGQQRTTALCVLSGRKPYWWASSTDWDRLVRKYDIRFDIHTREPPYFVVANAATRKVASSRYVPVRDIMNLDTAPEDDKKLQEYAKRVKLDGLCEGMDEMAVYSRLNSLRRIRDKEVVLITVDNDLEDVVEIFSRLNSRGTRVTEADIYLGVVAARSPGWVREEYLPFVESLGVAGFDVSPNLVFRTLTGIGRKRIRYKEIEDDFWSASNIKPVWERTKKAWSLIIRHFKDKGIGGNALLPSDNALVTLTALADRFPGESFDQTFFWFIQASRFARYSTSSTSSMEEDLKEVAESASLSDALERLLARIRYMPAVTADDFMRDYGDSRSGRLLLYLLIQKNAAIDWDQTGIRIGFDSTGLLSGFTPQFHHIFPKAFIDGAHPEDLVNALANIALIGPAINIRISKQNPMDYVGRYQISDKKLEQQYIATDLATTALPDFPQWVQRRAQGLANAANDYLSAHRGDLVLPAATKQEDGADHAYDTV
ncbi:DUF262 domain-containing protein [Methylocystis hirsuta]|nr:DUF262 domain-containing protein [Methylocystis hirsuta]